MNPTETHPRLRSQKGFTLAEIAVALGIFSFALVSMLGLLSVGMKNSRRANAQTSASNVMAGISADIQSSVKSTLSGVQTYKSPKLQIITTVTGGSVSAVRAGTSEAPWVVTESGAFVTPAVTASPFEKSFSLTLSPPAGGTLGVRVRLEWPSNRPVNTNPEGYIETLVPLPF